MFHWHIDRQDFTLFTLYFLFQLALLTLTAIRKGRGWQETMQGHTSIVRHSVYLLYWYKSTNTEALFSISGSPCDTLGLPPLVPQASTNVTATSYVLCCFDNRYSEEDTHHNSSTLLDWGLGSLLWGYMVCDDVYFLSTLETLDRACLLKDLEGYSLGLIEKVLLQLSTWSHDPCGSREPHNSGKCRVTQRDFKNFVSVFIDFLVHLVRRPPEASHFEDKNKVMDKVLQFDTSWIGQGTSIWHILNWAETWCAGLPKTVR